MRLANLLSLSPPSSPLLLNAVRQPPQPVATLLTTAPAWWLNPFHASPRCGQPASSADHAAVQQHCCLVDGAQQGRGWLPLAGACCRCCHCRCCHYFPSLGGRVPPPAGARHCLRCECRHCCPGSRDCGWLSCCVEGVGRAAADDSHQGQRSELRNPQDRDVPPQGASGGPADSVCGQLSMLPLSPPCHAAPPQRHAALPPCRAHSAPQCPHGGGGGSGLQHVRGLPELPAASGP